MAQCPSQFKIGIDLRFTSMQLKTKINISFSIDDCKQHTSMFMFQLRWRRQGKIPTDILIMVEDGSVCYTPRVSCPLFSICQTKMNTVASPIEQRMCKLELEPEPEPVYKRVCYDVQPLHNSTNFMNKWIEKITIALNRTILYRNLRRGSGGEKNTTEERW